ncbi:ATP-binding protein [Streptomyces sp. NPDC054783]
MTDMDTALRQAPRAPVMVEGDNPAGIARARDVARAFADGLELAAPPGIAETLALVVSELATNAVRHGGGRYTLHLVATTDAITVAVSDLSPAPLQERAPASTATPAGSDGPWSGAWPTR